ncbi:MULTISPECIES: DUF4238 domain-containing protein [unclassified Pseudoalteromonas]|uniref:DUF4238 domain-containing protein n=1 Tax=unclassified Pseudoalteromonas TaxID=194690 RepID=UPI0005AB8791|nr:MULTISPECIES: DUF4238 domain-containing protein [unclassified Pseudoalteromonas]
MSQTVRQHYVPRVYLKAWSCPKGKVKVLDKKTGKIFTPAVENICLEKYFYENPKLPPTNEIENMFCDYEGKFGKTRDFLSAIKNNAIELSQPISETLANALNALPDHLRILKEFACISYFRTPKAFQEMLKQLKADNNPEAAKAIKQLESPYALNKQAFESTIFERFKKMHIAILFSETDLITGDAPCIPLAGGTGHSNYAYDIGRHEASFAAMAITSNIVVMFMPNLTANNPIIIPRDMPKELSLQLNEIIMEHSQRWVISTPSIEA